MTMQDAIKSVYDLWSVVVSERYGMPVVLDHNLTIEYDWGWVFSFVPIANDNYLRCSQFACDRLTGNSVPVGTKGIESAIDHLDNIRFLE